MIADVSDTDATAKAVVTAVLAGADLDKAAADTVRTAFNALVAAVPTVKPDAHKAIADALLGNQTAQVADSHALFVSNLTQGA